MNGVYKEVFSKIESLKDGFEKFVVDENSAKITKVALSILALAATSYLLIRSCSFKKTSSGSEIYDRITKAREEEGTLRFRDRSQAVLGNVSESIRVDLPVNSENLFKAILPLRRLMESLYSRLPWPNSLRNIMVFTQVQGGLGDIAAAAKVINLMKEIRPDIHVDWALLGSFNQSFDPKMFLKNSSNVFVQKINYASSEVSERKDPDFLIMGPVKNSFSKEYINEKTGKEVNGSVFTFFENGQSVGFLKYADGGFLEGLKWAKKSAVDEIDFKNKVYGCMFPAKGMCPDEAIPMGLEPGSGVLLDEDLMMAPLSRGYCCPSYLSQIDDPSLRKDILWAMGSSSEPNYDQYSFNCGYAHHEASWGKFIDCVAMHEKHKDVVIVLNQFGEFTKLSGAEFKKQIFTKERLALLKKQGYGNVSFKDESYFLSSMQKGPGRTLTVITRPKFLPKDMRRLQLASERILGTGDNSAVEAWCARCKLFLYEDVANISCKWKFLQQQVDLAESIYPPLGRLLALFGGDRRTDKDFLNKPLDEDKMQELESLLKDPHLSDATLEFCDTITSQYAFADVLKGALKRTAWHHCIPDLAKIEANFLGRDFYSQIDSYLNRTEEESSSLEMRLGLDARSQIHELVEDYQKKA